MMTQHWLMLVVVFLAAWYLAKHSGVSLPVIG